MGDSTGADKAEDHDSDSEDSDIVARALRVSHFRLIVFIHCLTNAKI